MMQVPVFAVRRVAQLCHGCFLVLLAFLSLSQATAAPTSAAQAQALVEHWLARDPAPLHAPLSPTIAAVTPYGGTPPLYYAVSLAPTGYVIVSGDDLAEPIIAFVASGCYYPSTSTTMGALVNRDLPQRIALAGYAVGARSGPAVTAALAGASRAQQKWATYLATPARTVKPAVIDSISDLRVDTFVHSLWDQMTVSSDPNLPACYNYYTPPYANGDPANYPCGCVATAMAQVMRYWQYPTTAVGTTRFPITVDGGVRKVALRGGNGTGGPYSWGTMMPLDPSTPLASVEQCQAIGALCYDAGVAVKMDYSANGSGAWDSDMRDALVNVFHYSNAILSGDGATNIGAGLQGMINPNLDAGFPVLLGIDDGVYGHEIVCDGYGYNAATPYHHLNLGWSGYDNAWYNLPTIDTSVITFTNVDCCTYNIYTTGSGEIISGRVLDPAGKPVAGAAVTAVGAGITYPAVATNARGIYAIAKIPSSTQYVITATADGWQSQSITVTTGDSHANLYSSGNIWGANIQLSAGGPPALSLNASATPANVGTGTVVTYTLAYQNTGAGPSTNTTITNSLPSGVTYVANSAVGAVYTAATHTLTWNLHSISAGQSGSATCKVTIDANTAIGTTIVNTATMTCTEVAPVVDTASFTIQATITPQVGTFGRIAPNVPTLVSLNGHLDFTATPNTGYVVDTWTVDNVAVQSGGVGYTLAAITANHTVKVTFARAFAITLSASANGTIAPDSPQSVISGKSLLCTASPATGYIVDRWYVDNISRQVGNTSFTLLNVTAPHVVKVTFKLLTYTLTPSAGIGGTISPLVVPPVTPGADVTFTARPSSSYVVDRWYVDNNAVQIGNTQYKITNVSANHTIKVTFLRGILVLPLISLHGKLAPATQQYVRPGDDLTFQATPDARYTVDTWYVDGVAMQTGNLSFTLTNVQLFHTVKATFKLATT